VKQELPQGWQWVELGKVCEVRKGVTPRREWYAVSGLHIIKFRDIGGEINWEPGLRGRVKPQYEGKLRRLQAGMTLIGADAHNPEFIGRKVSFADSIPEEPVFFSAELLAMAPKPDGRIAPKWPFFWFSSQGGYLAVQEKVVGVHLNSNPAKTIEIPLPPISEQERIVAILESAMTAAERARGAAQDRAEATRALGAAFLREIFVFGNGALPRGWKWGELGDLCEVKRGKSITRKQITPGEIPVIAGGQQPAYYHSKANRTGEVITVSGSGAYAGFVNFFDRPIFASDCSTLQVKDGKAQMMYLYVAMKWRQQDIYNLRLGSAQPHVYPKDVSKIEIPIPPLGEQRQIVATLDAKMAAVEKARAAAEAELEAIEALPGALLRQAFRGEL